MDIKHILAAFHDVIIFGHPNEKILDMETFNREFRKDISSS